MSQSVYLDPEENLFPPTHNDSDSQDDSDAKELFELPKKRIIRPPSSATKRKLNEKRNNCWQMTCRCTKATCTWIAPLLVAVFIVSTSICLLFLLSTISTMRTELVLIKTRLKNADAIEMEFNAQKKIMQTEFNKKLKSFEKQQNVSNVFLLKVKGIEQKLLSLNFSLISLQRSSSTKTVSHDIMLIQRDIDIIKTGMADTGSDIAQLESEQKTLDESIDNLKQNNALLKIQITNLTGQILDEKVSFKPTLKTIVVEVTPDSEKPVLQKDFHIVVRDLQESQVEACQNETAFLLQPADAKNVSSKGLSFTSQPLLTKSTTAQPTKPPSTERVQTANPTKVLRSSQPSDVTSAHIKFTPTQRGSASGGNTEESANEEVNLNTENTDGEQIVENGRREENGNIENENTKENPNIERWGSENVENRRHEIDEALSSLPTRVDENPLRPPRDFDGNNADDNTDFGENDGKAMELLADLIKERERQGNMQDSELFNNNDNDV